MSALNFSGTHFKTKNCDATKLHKKIQEEVKMYSALLYPKELEYIHEVQEPEIWRRFGGFDSKEDQELCLGFSACNDKA